MASIQQSSEQRELFLIGKVEMRIALADSDNKLESILNPYLAPLLLKLESEHVNVRNKVIAVCQHINARIQPESIQLPVSALIKQLKEVESPLVRQFDLLYINKGVGRLPFRQKAELLPIVAENISKSGKQAPQVFNLLLRLLDSFTLPPRGSNEDLELRIKLLLSDADAGYTSNWLGKLMLFQNPKAANAISPGLDLDGQAFIGLEGQPTPWDPSTGGMNLLRTKVLAAKLLASGAFTDHERILPALFASADPASTISDIGEDMLKRTAQAVTFEDESLIGEMLGYYFGGRGRPRVKPHLRSKMLGLFCKSMEILDHSDVIERIVDDGLSLNRSSDGDFVMSNTPQSIDGREASKLRSAIFQFINYAARHAPTTTLLAIAPRTISRLRDYVENQGWPSPGTNEDLISRGFAYEVMGLLAKSGPRAVLIEDGTPSLELVRWLFQSLERDISGSSVVVSIEEALSSVMTRMSQIELTPQEQGCLENLLLERILCGGDSSVPKKIRSSTFVTVRYANRCLPYDSVKARWINVLALGSENDRTEIFEEAGRGLSPYWYGMLRGIQTDARVESTQIQHPSFVATMAQFFFSRAANWKCDPMVLARDAYRQNPTTFPHMVDFARHLLYCEAFVHASASVTLDSDWERRLDTAAQNDLQARKSIRRYSNVLRSNFPNVLETLLCALFIALNNLPKDSKTDIVELLRILPEDITAFMVPHMADLITVLKVSNYERRLAAAECFGILASHPSASPSAVLHYTSQLATEAAKRHDANGAAVHQVHGAVTALAFFYSRAAYRDTAVSDTEGYRSFIHIVLDMVNNVRDESLREAAYITLGQLSMFGALQMNEVERTMSVQAVTDKLILAAKAGNGTAITALGRFSLLFPEAHPQFTHLEEEIYRLHDIRQVEAHFTVGEALSIAACGWESGALTTILVDQTAPQLPPRNSTLSRVLDKVLTSCANTKPALKKASVIWLLCLIEYCGEFPELQERLPRCQFAFKHCLVDRDELVQDTASRGLGLVYERGDRRLKDDLVRDLIASFSSDGKTQLAGSVSAETELFEPGSLPTGDGSVSTYKDIMSLASEVGDSSLVYRFMSMASSNAIWSSRAAFGRFGLSSVLSDSSVDGYIAKNPKLYAKLFRYRFDPNSGVQRSMNEIWKALVKNSNSTINEYFHDIMEDLLISVLGKEWRVRQASCAAIADLVQSRPLERYQKYLEEIWTKCFKVLDDIKESVRMAAAALARVLTGILTRSLEADHTSSENAGKMLKNVLPFLLSTSGIESSAKEVQAFSISTLLDIIKSSSGRTLRPFIAQLVERLIGALSTFEPEAINYLHLNASKYNLTEQKIDDMRLNSVRSSPLMEMIERCLDLLDDKTMEELAPCLESAIRSAVGLPSKVGCSRVLVSLSTRRLVVFQPHADSIIRVIEKVILDRNETVASSYAVAAGYVARVASDKQILQLLAFAQKLYFDSEADRDSVVPRRSITSGEIVASITKHASDRFNALSASALPFVFIAKHDENEQVQEQFQSAWSDSVGGPRVIVLYLKEIISLCNDYLDSPRWVLKHATARSVADTVNAAASIGHYLSREDASVIWPALEKAIGGKTWDGKEYVLAAFVRFVETAKLFYEPDQVVSSIITKVALREAKRDNAAYKEHALKSLASICLARADIDISDEVMNAVEPLLLPASKFEDNMDVDEKAAGQKASEQNERLQATAIEALCASVNPGWTKAEALNPRMSVVIAHLARSDKRSATVGRSLYKSLASLFLRIHAAGAGFDPDEDTLSRLKYLLFEPELTSEALRLMRARSVVELTKVSRRISQELQPHIAVLATKETSKAVLECLALVPKYVEG